MCSNNISGFINKENVQPLSTICKLEKIDTSELNVIKTAPLELKSVTRHCDFALHRDDEDSDSDEIGTVLLKARKRRTDSPPRLKLESLGLNEKLYCDLHEIYVNGFEYSFEEIRYRKWLNCKKEKAEKRSRKEMAKEIVTLKKKIESSEQAIKLLQDKLSDVMELIQGKKTVNEDKQEVSTMVRDLINGSYNDTQIEKTMLKPVSSIPVKDFTIYKDMTIEEPTLVAPTQDNIPLIRFDITECGEAAKHLGTFENKKPTLGFHEVSIGNQEPSLRIYKDSIGIKELSEVHEASIQMQKPVLPIDIHMDIDDKLKQTPQIQEEKIEIQGTSNTHEDSIQMQKPVLSINMEIDIENELEPAPQIFKDSTEMKKPVLQIHEASIENKEPSLRIYKDSIGLEEPSKIHEDSIQMPKQVLPIDIHMDIENKLDPTSSLPKTTVEMEKPTLQIQEKTVENVEPEPQIHKNIVEMKEPNLQIYEDSIEIKEPNCDFLKQFSTERHDPIDMEIEKAELKISQIKSALGESKRKSLLGLRDNNKLSIIAENSRDSTNATEKNSPVKMCPPVVPCKSLRSDFDLADLSVNPIIHRGSMNFRFSEAFTMHIPNSEDECLPKSCSTPGRTLKKQNCMFNNLVVD